jgi:hypothetical protein
LQLHPTVRCGLEQVAAGYTISMVIPGFFTPLMMAWRMTMSMPSQLLLTAHCGLEPVLARGIANRWIKLHFKA